VGTTKNRRVIDGKPMFWLNQTKRWVDDKKATPGANVAAALVAPSPSVPAPVPSLVSVPTNQASRDLALAQATHSINARIWFDG
jgi:hypothetical protein